MDIFLNGIGHKYEAFNKRIYSIKYSATSRSVKSDYYTPYQ